jgi:DNA-binding MarR family transcriptional regulator
MTTNSRLGEMTTDHLLVRSLEEIAYATVGMTALALNEVGQERDLTLAQWRVLVILGEGPMRVGSIAERIGASLPSASRLVARMEAREFVVTAPDESDRRAILVSLAPLGRNTRNGVIQRRRRLIEELVGGDGSLANQTLERGMAILAERFSRFA